MNKKPSYIFSADIIRDIAIFGVVSIHIANAVYTRADFFGGMTWWATIVIDSLSRISIPLFIMLSGYLMLGKDESFEQSLKRIFHRIAIPLAFWFTFYIWYGGGLPSLRHFNSHVLPNAFLGNMYHLYFLVIIIGLYFMAPLIRSFLRTHKASSNEFATKTFLILGVVLVAFQFVFQACGYENFFTKWIPYTGLFIAGFILGNKSDSFGRNKLLALYLLGFTVTLVGNYFQYSLAGANYSFLSSRGCLSHYTDHYLSVNVVIMSISAFLLLLNLRYTWLKNSILSSSLVHSIARASFGIYIIHPFVARFLEMQFHLAVDFSPLPLPVIIFSRLILVLFISYLITILLLRTPIVKLVFGAK